MKNRKTLFLLLAVAALAVVAICVVATRGRNHTFKQDFQIEAAARPGGVTKIFMADKHDSQVLLSYVNDSLWMVDNTFKASQSMVDLLLSTLSDMRIRNVVNKSAVENVVTLMATGSVKVEVYYNDYRINWFGGKLRLFPHEKREVFYVGHDTPDQMSTYMLREGDKVPVVAHVPGFRGCLSPRFVVNPLAWRSHSIVDLPVQRIAKIELLIPSMPEESFSIEREGDGFVMNLLNPPARVQGFDTARVAQLLSSFVNLNFDEYARAVPKVELDTTFARDPRTILRISDTEGNVRELKTYIKYVNPDDAVNMPDTTMYEVFDLNRLYAVLDNADTVLIQYYVFDNILQPASFFLGRDKSTFAR